MTSRTLAVVSALMALSFTLTNCSDSRYTRGIGVYPGKCEDYSGPRPESGGREYRNLALGRAAWHSTSYDYNLTAHLVTDGIISENKPLVLEVESSDGPVGKNQRDLLFDGNDKRFLTVSTKPSDGGSAFVRAEFKNITIDCDKVVLQTDGPDVAVSCEDGSVFTANLPKRSGDGIRLYLMRFFKDGREIPVYSGEFFTSCWMPETAGEEWLYIDLGAVSRFDRICLSWIGKAPKGRIEISDDLDTWKVAAPIPDNGESHQEIRLRGRARFVRLSIDESADGEPCTLSEMEVWGRGGLIPRPARQPEAHEGILNLRGGNWKIIRSSQVQSPATACSSCCASDVNCFGEMLSRAGYNDSGWMPATVPGAVSVSYLNAGAIPDQRYDTDQLQISESFFLSDFWYRDEFTVPADFKGSTVLLNFEGINWKADIWVNGSRAGRIEGAFKRGTFDVTELIVPGGRNCIAVLIHRNAHPGGVKEQTRFSADNNGGAPGADNPTFHPTIGWDWIPTVRGRNIGIWKDVTLSAHRGGVSIDNPFVTTDLPLPDTLSARIRATVDVTNHKVETVEGKLCFSFGDLSASTGVVLQAGETKTVELPEVLLDNPRLWWPAGYGEPYLYDAAVEFVCHDTVSDRKAFKTGVRELSYDDSDGSLDIFINGRRLIGNGGNWGFPEINLNYRAREYDIAVAYHADMGFTLIRNWVGQTGDHEFYEACDRHGVMVWQDFWLANPWDGPDPLYEDLFMENAGDYILRTRNHPCIALYCGRNEGMPPASIDAALRSLVADKHPDSHYIPHSAQLPVSGYGPYRALGADSYFDLQEGRSTLHSERGMPNVMTYEGICRMLREQNRWPQNSVWGLHDYVLSSAQRCSTFNRIMEQNFGEAADLKQFARWAQWINYDGYRAMFESRSYERKGLLIWMSHSSWPSMVWQTYDYYLEPTAAYFGAKKGSAPIRIQYNPATSQVEVVNNCAGLREGLTARVEVLDMLSNVLQSGQYTLDSCEDSTIPVCKLNTDTDCLTDVYYIRLGLSGSKGQLADNFYVREKESGSLKALLSLGEPELDVNCSFSLRNGEYRGTAILKNTGDIPALMVRLKVVRSRSGELVLPVLYADNYISLMPGESRQINISFKKEDTGGERPALIWEPGL